MSKVRLPPAVCDSLCILLLLLLNEIHQPRREMLRRQARDFVDQNFDGFDQGTSEDQRIIFREDVSPPNSPPPPCEYILNEPPPYSEFVETHTLPPPPAYDELSHRSTRDSSSSSSIVSVDSEDSSLSSDAPEIIYENISILSEDNEDEFEVTYESDDVSEIPSPQETEEMDLSESSAELSETTEEEENSEMEVDTVRPQQRMMQRVSDQLS